MTGSIAVRRSLGRQLHALRLATGKSLMDVDATKIVSRRKLLAMESGKRPIKVADVMSLYDADGETADRLVEMARHRDESGWWEDYSDVLSPKFRLFVELESAAESVFTYDSELLYGLLQTPDYHRAIYDADPAAARGAARAVAPVSRGSPDLRADDAPPRHLCAERGGAPTRGRWCHHHA